jgi:hypothetical protein
VHHTMGAVGTEDGRTHVLLHLSAAECAWSAAALSPPQRTCRAVPARMPLLHCLFATGDAVVLGKCSEAASRAAWRVLQEDVVLGFSAEVRHAAVVHGRGVDASVSDPPRCARRNLTLCQSIDAVQSSRK